MCVCSWQQLWKTCGGVITGNIRNYTLLGGLASSHVGGLRPCGIWSRVMGNRFPAFILGPVDLWRKARRSFENSWTIYPVTQRHNPKWRTTQRHHHENTKTCSLSCNFNLKLTSLLLCGNKVPAMANSLLHISKGDLSEWGRRLYKRILVYMIAQDSPPSNSK